MAQAATVALLQALSSQWLSFFVSTLEALNFQPIGLANPSAEGWWPQRGDVFPGPAGLQKASWLAEEGRARGSSGRVSESSAVRRRRRRDWRLWWCGG